VIEINARATAVALRPTAVSGGRPANQRVEQWQWAVVVNRLTVKSDIYTFICHKGRTLRKKDRQGQKSTM